MHTTTSRKGIGAPKTPEGKRRVSINALKHGLCAESWAKRHGKLKRTGWQGTGQNRLYPSQSKALGFASLDLSGDPVVSGLHVGYNVGCKEETAAYKATLPSQETVPEPAPLIALGTDLVGSIWVLKRRAARG